MDWFIQSGTAPFWIALLTVIGLGLVELVSVLVGASLVGLFDDAVGAHDTSGSGAGLLGGWMSWLNGGGVPLLVLAVILLSAFAAFGFAIQSVAAGLTGPLPAIVSVPLAAAGALPATRGLSRAVAKIIPRDETNAIEQGDFIGLTGFVALGPLDQGKPGRVRVKDRFDNFHVLRATAARGHVIETGSFVLIIDGCDGLFQAIPAPAELADLDSKEV